MVLSPIATGVEALVTKVTLEGLLAGMNPLVHLVIGLCIKCSATRSFNAYHRSQVIREHFNQEFQKGMILTIFNVFEIAYKQFTIKERILECWLRGYNLGLYLLNFFTI